MMHCAFQFVSRLLKPEVRLDLEETISTGSAELQTISDKYPLTQSVPKLDADIQVNRLGAEHEGMIGFSYPVVVPTRLNKITKALCLF